MFNHYAVPRNLYKIILNVKKKKVLTLSCKNQLRFFTNQSGFVKFKQSCRKATFIF